MFGVFWQENMFWQKVILSAGYYFTVNVMSGKKLLQGQGDDHFWGPKKV